MLFIASFCLRHPEESGGPTSCPAALRPLELRAGRDRSQGRALPCGRRRPPGAAGGGTAAGVSEGLGFSLVLIQPSACVLAAGLSSAVGGASLLWVIRHEPKPPALCPCMSVVYTADIGTQVSPLTGEGPLGSSLCFRAEAAPGDVLVGIKPLSPLVGSG